MFWGCFAFQSLFGICSFSIVGGKKQWWWQPLAPPLTVGQKVQTTTNCSKPLAFYLLSFCISVFLYFCLSIFLYFCTSAFLYSCIYVSLALPLTIGQKVQKSTNSSSYLDFYLYISSFLCFYYSVFLWLYIYISISGSEAKTSLKNHRITKIISCLHIGPILFRCRTVKSLRSQFGERNLLTTKYQWLTCWFWLKWPKLLQFQFWSVWRL